MKTRYKIVIGILLLTFGIFSNVAPVTFAQESNDNDNDNDNDDMFYLEQECKSGMFAAYKIDNSKIACVTPHTLDKLVTRSWAFGHDNKDGIYVDANSTTENFIGCDVNQIPIQGGYFLFDDNDNSVPIEFLGIKESTRNGYKGFTLTFYNPTDDTFSPRGPLPYIFADCLLPPANSFHDCMDDRSRLFNDDNWPILECTTRNGEFFSINEAEEMKKISGISMYTVNFLSSHSLEIVGKTDRTDEIISFSITAPNGDEISEWKEFAPTQGEFRITITTGETLWEKQDGFYKITATQIDVPYYVTSAKFEIRDNGMVIPKHVSTFDYIIETQNITYGNQYQITGGMINEITYDEYSNSMIILLDDNAGKGYMEIVLPPGLLSPANKIQLVDYFVIVDGKDTSFEQLSPILFKIPFEKDAKKIEIIGVTG